MSILQKNCLKIEKQMYGNIMMKYFLLILHEFRQNVKISNIGKIFHVIIIHFINQDIANTNNIKTNNVLQLLLNLT